MIIPITRKEGYVNRYFMLSVFNNNTKNDIGYYKGIELAYYHPAYNNCWWLDIFFPKLRFHRR